MVNFLGEMIFPRSSDAINLMYTIWQYRQGLTGDQNKIIRAVPNHLCKLLLANEMILLIDEHNGIRNQFQNRPPSVTCSRKHFTRYVRFNMYRRILSAVLVI